MRESLATELAPSIQIGGSFATCPEENFQPGLLGYICKRIWPDKTDVHVALIVGCSPRAAREYLNDEVAAPAILITRINQAITRRPRR